MNPVLTFWTKGSRSSSRTRTSWFTLRTCRVIIKSALPALPARSQLVLNKCDLVQPLSPFSPTPGGPDSPRGPIGPSRPLCPDCPSGPGSPGQKQGDSHPECPICPGGP
uniref:Uncharacterized protein n=1 Tax=Xiphophorus couchianus TaxID=32473 RepID=A0A3B5LN54_9TELE